MIALLVVILILLICVLLGQKKNVDEGRLTQLSEDAAESRSLAEDIEEQSGDIQDELVRLGGQFEAAQKANAEYNNGMRREVTEHLQGILRENAGMRESMITTLSDATLRMQKSNEEHAGQLQATVDARLTQMQTAADSRMNQVQSAVDNRLKQMQEGVDARLSQIQGVVDQKLEHTLNERLDSNFKQVSEQLSNLYRSLTELKDLSTGVEDLNRTLSNVKTRGTWGEVQLGRILEQTMTKGQYEVNVATKKNSSDRVEYAIRFPASDGSDSFVWLPIDAKFPADIYNRIADAAERSDQTALAAATAELKGRIRDEARTIRDKYLDPPRTTNYAMMFLPTEGLYAEVLRVDGLTEECQKNGVIVVGPTTVTAVLNSLQSGFRNVALSNKSREVLQLLEAVKGQVARLNETVERTQKKLAEASGLTDDLHRRTSRIQSRMRTIGEMDSAASDRLLELGEGTGEENGESSASEQQMSENNPDSPDNHIV